MGALAVFLFFLSFFLSTQQLESALVPAGTRIDARLESAVETATSNAGDAIAAVVAAPVRVAGKIVIPRGSRLNGRVETIAAATQTTEGRVRLVFREIQLPDGRAVSTWITNSFTASPPKKKLRYAISIGIGAAAGTFIGGRSARVAGIIGGTLLGFIVATNSVDGKLPDLDLEPGRTLQFQFGEDLRL